MSQVLITLLSGGGAAALGGMTAIVRVAYQRGKQAGRAEATLETLKRSQEEMAARLAQLENEPPGSRSRRWRRV